MGTLALGLTSGTISASAGGVYFRRQFLQCIALAVNKRPVQRRARVRDPGARMSHPRAHHRGGLVGWTRPGLVPSVSDAAVLFTSAWLSYRSRSADGDCANSLSSRCSVITVSRRNGHCCSRCASFLRTLGIEIVFRREGRLGTRTIRITATGEDQSYNTVSTVSRVSDNNGGHGAGLRHPPSGREQAL